MRHLVNRIGDKRKAFRWSRWRGGGLMHYQLWDDAQVPPMTVTSSFDYGVERTRIAGTLRRLRRMLRENNSP